MSAATEFHGYLLSQGYGQEQIAHFAYFADQANKGVISHNQAYRMAIDEGWDSADGKFKDWLNNANEQGWIDKGLNVFGTLAGSGVLRKKDSTSVETYNYPDYKDLNEKKSITPYVIGGVVLIGIGVAIYFATRKKII